MSKIYTKDTDRDDVKTLLVDCECHDVKNTRENRPRDRSFSLQHQAAGLSPMFDDI